MSLLPPGTARTDEAGMKKSHIVYTRFVAAKKALCSAASKGKAEVMAAAQEFGLAKDEYDKLPLRAGILGGKSRRRKTRGSRRKTRGGLNPIGSPDTPEARHRVVVEAYAQRQAKPASAAAVGGPSPGAPPPPPSSSVFPINFPSPRIPATLKNLFRPKESPHQENPQDVARRKWCDTNFGRIPARQLQCYQEAPDDVSDTKRWPENKRAGRRRITRRR
jgi:hypothetical protein